MNKQAVECSDNNVGVMIRREEWNVPFDININPCRVQAGCVYWLIKMAKLYGEKVD